MSKSVVVTEEDKLGVFVSYSHEETKWLERVRVHLAPLVRDNAIDVWDDTRIRPGAVWKVEVEQALSSAGVAILLVSARYLASEFIAHNELPPLLTAASERGSRIVPVILSACGFARTPLAQFQAVNDPKTPLEELTFGEQERVFERIAETVYLAMQERNVTRIATLAARPEDEVHKQQELVNLLVVFSMAFFLFRLLDDFDKCEKGEIERYLHTKSASADANLRWLRDHGYLEMNFQVAALKDGQDIAKLVKLTPVGKLYVQLRRTYETSAQSRRLT